MSLIRCFWLASAALRYLRSERFFNASKVMGSSRHKSRGGCSPAAAHNTGVRSNDSRGFFGDGTQQYLTAEWYAKCVHDQWDARPWRPKSAFFIGKNRKPLPFSARTAMWSWANATESPCAWWYSRHTPTCFNLTTCFALMLFPSEYAGCFAASRTHISIEPFVFEPGATSCVPHSECDRFGCGRVTRYTCFSHPLASSDAQSSRMNKGFWRSWPTGIAASAFNSVFTLRRWLGTHEKEDVFRRTRRKGFECATGAGIAVLQYKAGRGWNTLDQT